MAWIRTRSEKRRDESDHTRITLLEDDADETEARVHTLENQERERQKREAVEASWGGAVRFLGLSIVGVAGGAVVEIVRVLHK